MMNITKYCLSCKALVKISSNQYGDHCGLFLHLNEAYTIIKWFLVTQYFHPLISKYFQCLVFQFLRDTDYLSNHFLTAALIIYSHAPRSDVYYFFYVHHFKWNLVCATSSEDFFQCWHDIQFRNILSSTFKSRHYHY